MKRFLVLLFLLCTPCMASEDYYHFDSPTKEARFLSLTSELRCLVCQNQNLAESNSALAGDLREQVYQHLKQGETDKDIIAYLVGRYGNFILYRPPLTLSTYALWFGPLFLLIGGLVYLFYYLQKHARE